MSNDVDVTARVEVKVEGTYPLLLDAWNAESEASVDKASRSGQNVKGVETPRDVAGKRLYVDSEGTPIFPAENLFSGIVAAGIFQKVGTMKLTTRDSSLIPGALRIMEPTIPIKPGKWEVDKRRAVNQKVKAAINAIRPRFDKWSLEFTIEFDTDLLHPNTVRQLVDDLGKRIGIGVFRPQRKGPFGTFKVTKWDEELPQVMGGGKQTKRAA
jgi:hypothetical protein